MEGHGRGSCRKASEESWVREEGCALAPNRSARPTNTAGGEIQPTDVGVASVQYVVERGLTDSARHRAFSSGFIGLCAGMLPPLGEYQCRFRISLVVNCSQVQQVYRRVQRQLLRPSPSPIWTSGMWPVRRGVLHGRPAALRQPRNRRYVQNSSRSRGWVWMTRVATF